MRIISARQMRSEKNVQKAHNPHKPSESFKQVSLWANTSNIACDLCATLLSVSNTAQPRIQSCPTPPLGRLSHTGNILMTLFYTST